MLIKCVIIPEGNISVIYIYTYLFIFIFTGKNHNDRRVRVILILLIYLCFDCMEAMDRIKPKLNILWKINILFYLQFNDVYQVIYNLWFEKQVQELQYKEVK